MGDFMTGEIGLDSRNFELTRNGRSTARSGTKKLRPPIKFIGSLLSIALVSVHGGFSFAASTDINNGTTGGSLGTGDTFIQVDKGANNNPTGSATILFKPQISVSPIHHLVGSFAQPVFADLSGGSNTDTYAIWDAKVGDSITPFANGQKGNFAIYEGNIDTAQSSGDAQTGADGMRIFAGTVTGRGGVRLGGSSIAIVVPSTATTDAIVVGHDLGIQKNHSGSSTVLGFNANSSGTFSGTDAFYGYGRWDYGFTAYADGGVGGAFTGIAAFSVIANSANGSSWDAAFDGGGYAMRHIGTFFGNQVFSGGNIELRLLGGASNTWTMQTVDSDGRYRIYDVANGERYAISKGASATHTFTGNAKISGLGGTGSRTVVADASGNLTAPVSDAKLKKNMRAIGEEMDVLALLEDNGIRGIFYEWNDVARGAEREVGFTAQMFQEIAGLTGTMNDSGHAYLNYERLTALLWEQNRLLLAQNKALVERVNAIEKTMEIR
jgi:hypothetical protein